MADVRARSIRAVGSKDSQKLSTLANGLGHSYKEHIGEPRPGFSQTDSEMCVGCQFVWDRTNQKLDQSSGYEATKDAFERTCADMPNVFFDACDAMFEKEDMMVQDYLNGAKFEDMCKNALLCIEPVL